MAVVQIFDTTLRDGEQSPGASMSIDQKVEIALQLARLGVDVIEAGFPISSPQQFEACKTVAERVEGPVITALARAVEADINAAADSLRGGKRTRIHTFVATSPIHMRHKLGKSEPEVLEMAVSAVKLARSYSDNVEFSPEDATRSEADFLYRVLEAVIDAGAGVVNIPDTVGYAVPGEFGSFINDIRNNVPNIDKAVISVHCHNDLGLGVANTLSAIDAGARQAELTINGLGERAGNAALEEVVMALSVRNDAVPHETSIDKSQIFNTSRLVSNIVGFPIPRNKPIVGDNAFAHEAGIHQHGVIKHRETYEIMTPESVGRDFSSIVLGRHSGKHGFRKRLAELGLSLTDEEFTSSYERFLQIADKKKEVFDDDLYAIVGDELGRQTTKYDLEYYHVSAGNLSIPTATVRIRKEDKTIEQASTGDGPVDAVFFAIDKAIGSKTSLKEYAVQAVTPGKEALGEVTVVLEIDGDVSTGRGSSTDIIEASARAYVNALNRHELSAQEGARK